MKRTDVGEIRTREAIEGLMGEAEGGYDLERAQRRRRRRKGLSRILADSDLQARLDELEAGGEIHRSMPRTRSGCAS